MIIRNVPSGSGAANTYLVVDENTKKGFIVDPGGYDPKMVNQIEENQYEILYVILTHGHGDHIGGVPAYLNHFPGSKLVAANAEKELLANPNLNFSEGICGTAVSLTADLYVIEGDTLSVGDLELKFIMTPGHTKGGMCILVGNSLFSGDTLFQSSVGRTDFPGGSFAELADSISKKLYTLPEETKVFPGHMGTTDIAFEKRNNPFV